VSVCVCTFVWGFWWQVPFLHRWPHGVLKHLEYLLETKGKVVMCVAEGAGQVHSPPPLPLPLYSPPRLLPSPLTALSLDVLLQ